MEPNPREGEMKGMTGNKTIDRKQKEKIENPYT
jgi:hypothetical protein